MKLSGFFPLGTGAKFCPLCNKCIPGQGLKPVCQCNVGWFKPVK